MRVCTMRGENSMCKWIMCSVRYLIEIILWQVKYNAINNIHNQINMVSSTCLVPFHQGLIPRGCVDLLHGYIDKLFTMPYFYISHIGCLGDLFHEYWDKLFTRPYIHISHIGCQMLLYLV